MTTSNESMIDIQLKLEEEMTSNGIERYLHEVAEAKVKGTEDKLAASQTLMKHHTRKLVLAISEWLDGCTKGNAGNRNVAYKYLRDLDVNMVAYVTLKRLLARISVPVVVQRAARELGTAIEDEGRLAVVREQEKKTYDSIIRGSKKRVSDHYKRMYALRRASEAVEFDQWPEIDRMHVGMKLMDLAMDTLGWFMVETRKVGNNNTQKLFVADPELIRQLDANHEMTATLRPIYEPMVVTPRDWTTPHDGGYISSSIRPLKLVKVSSRGYYEELATTEMPIVYAAVNAIQSTAWQINTQVLTVLKQFWELGHATAGLPAALGAEIPAKPFDIETNEEARNDWKRAAAKMHQQNTEERSKRASVNFCIGTAERFNEFPRIYMPTQLDFRGRIYSVPTFNPQGPDFMKALLRFCYGKPLGANGAQWLAMHGSNVAGNDKCSLEERVQWVLSNEAEILRCANDPLGEKGWYTEINGQSIDKPWQFLSFCFEWAGYREVGESFVSKVAVALDGSCSGLQHFSAMLRDDVGGRAVNLIPAETPQDVYGLVAEKVNTEIDTLLASEPSPEGDFAKQWRTFGVDRKTTKRSVMTLAYGSRQYGFKNQLMEDILEPAFKAYTRDGGVWPFEGDGFKAASFMAKLIWDAVTCTLVKSVEAMTWLQQAASLASAERIDEEGNQFSLPIRWSSPVGFPVIQAYWDIRTLRVKTALQGSIIQARMAEFTDTLDRRAQANGISPNFIHSCDAAHMMLTSVRAHQEGIKSFSMIHDSFGTTAAETEDLFRIVREAFTEMYTDCDVLEEFRDEIVRQLPEGLLKDLPELPDKGTLDLAGVLTSRFSFA